MTTEKTIRIGIIWIGIITTFSIFVLFSTLDNPPKTEVELGKTPKISGQNYPLYPKRSLTPGDIDRKLTQEYLCSHSTKERRNVPEARKKFVYKQYKVAYPQPKGSYELDHFISLCLGGTNSEDNLWPQGKDLVYDGTRRGSDGWAARLGFHEKDRLETYACREMCKGNLTLDQARKLIWIDWVKAYQELIEPRLGGIEDFEECEEGCP